MNRLSWVVRPCDALVAAELLHPIPDWIRALIFRVGRCGYSHLMSQPGKGDEHVVQDIRGITQPGDRERSQRSERRDVGVW